MSRQRELDYYEEHRHGIRLDSGGGDPLRLDDTDDLSIDNGGGGDVLDDEEVHSPGNILIQGNAAAFAQIAAHHSHDLDQNNGKCLLLGFI